MLQTSPRLIAEQIQSLKSSGNTTELSTLLRELNNVLSLSWDVYAPIISEAEANEQRLANQTPKELKEVADGEGVQFSAHPPFYRAGCIKLKRKEKRFDQWELSALDNVVVETIQASSGRMVMERVLVRIKEIEATLQRAQAYAKELKTAYSLLQESSAGLEKVSPNLLMVLTATKNLRKILISGDASEAPQKLSRAAFGYLLAKLNKEAVDNGLQIELKPATQLETSKPQAFLSVPIGSLNPRELSEARSIAAVKVIV